MAVSFSYKTNVRGLAFVFVAIICAHFCFVLNSKAVPQKNEQKSSEIQQIVAPQQVAALTPTYVDGPKIRYSSDGHPVLPDLKDVELEQSQGKYLVKDGSRTAFLTLDPELQDSSEALLKKYTVPWGAIVAIEPKTGKVLVLSGHSRQEPESKTVALRSGFPAASLFKLVTASAAIEQAGLSAEDEIKFRGGTYTLSRGNYLPSAKADKKTMSLGSALGKSCNPVFGRIALTELERGTLETYAANFGFDSIIPFELPLEQSHFYMEDDDYARARTAAGFGDVTTSPVHAALFTAAVANQGEMMRPYVVQNITKQNGVSEYTARPSVFKKALLPSTAKELLHAMTFTVTEGTAKKQFCALKKTRYGDITVAAKTGTLSGTNPKGLYTWFVAAAPVEDPKIAIATLVINPGNARVKAGELGRRFLETYFKSETWEE